MTIRTRLKGMKQREAATIIGRSRSYVSQIVSGDRVPSLETVAKCSAALRLEDAEIGASVREMCPAIFARTAAPAAA